MELQKPFTALYEQGFRDGKNLAQKKFYAGYCLGGCLVGAGGGCLGALVDIEMLKDADVSKITYSSVAGSFVAGVLLFQQSKIEVPLRNFSSEDTLYIQGFIDGYNEIARPRKAIDSVGGWVIGSALSLGVIYLAFGVLCGIGMQ
ncbi:MAG: hypothetical protein ABIL20_08260 [candidate division WOR-3 bacterium]